jgi:thiol-disulfide isomerase/thioredoxin
MRRIPAGVIALGLAVLVGRADDAPPPNKSSACDDAPTPKGSPVFENLRKEFTKVKAQFDNEVRDARKAIAIAKTKSEKEVARQKLDELTNARPGPKYADRFLVFAEEHSEDPMAFAAAMMAFRLSARPATADNTLGKAIAYLKENYAAKPKIMQLVRIFEANKGPAGEALLREVLAKNPDPRVQAHACKALLAVSTRAKEKVVLNKQIKGKYARFFPDLSVGKPVPEIVAKNVRGQDVKLSDLRGQVVALNMWTTWCPHSRALIPQQREMAQRLKGRPFALVNINMDAKKETLTQFLAKENMPWRQWWVGDNSPLAIDWNIEYYPTTYVVDARGVIRASRTCWRRPGASRHGTTQGNARPEKESEVREIRAFCPQPQERTANENPADRAAGRRQRVKP